MEAILDEAIEYANTRSSSVRPSGASRPSQHMLADVAVDVNIARTLTWDLARRIAARRAMCPRGVNGQALDQRGHDAG